MSPLADIWRIARFDLGTAIRTKRALVALAVYVAAALATGAILVAIELEASDKLALAKAMTDAAAMKDGGPTPFVKAMTFLVGGDEELARHLLDIPAVVLGFFWTTQAFLPFLVALVSFDLVNSEVRNRSARFVLLRCSRASLLLGKMLSHGLLFLAVTVASNLALFIYAWVRLPGFDPMVSGEYLLWFWALTVPFGFTYLGLAALVSSLIDSGGLSLVALFGALIGLVIVSHSDTVGFLAPGAWKLGLWSHRPADVASSVVAYLAFGWVFLGGAYARFQRRDL